MTHSRLLNSHLRPSRRIDSLRNSRPQKRKGQQNKKRPSESYSDNSRSLSSSKSRLEWSPLIPDPRKGSRNTRTRLHRITQS